MAKKIVPGYFTPDQIKRLKEISKDEKNNEKLKNKTVGKDGFLKLMMTQLKHQDPLSPMNNKDFIAQMAQFSSVEQLKSIATNSEKSLKNDLNLSAHMESLKNQMALLTKQIEKIIPKKVDGKDSTKPIDGKTDGNTQAKEMKKALADMKTVNQNILKEMITLNKAIKTYGMTR